MKNRDLGVCWMIVLLLFFWNGTTVWAADTGDCSGTDAKTVTVWVTFSSSASVQVGGHTITSGTATLSLDEQATNKIDLASPLAVEKNNNLCFRFVAGAGWTPDNNFLAILVFAKEGTGGGVWPFSETLGSGAIASGASKHQWQGSSEYGTIQMVGLHKRETPNIPVIPLVAKADNTAWTFTLLFIDVDGNQHFTFDNDPCMKVGEGNCG